MTSKLETKGVRVFIGNIPFEANEEQMQSICELVGRVVEFRFVMDNKRGRHKGLGFCEYPDIDTAHSAIRNLNKHPCWGRELIVDWADNELRSQASLDKVLQVADSAGNRISNLMLRTEEEVMQIHPQDTGTLGEVAQVVHQLAPAQLLRCVSELQNLCHYDPVECKKYLSKNPLLAHAMQHTLFCLGIASQSGMIQRRQQTSQQDDDDDTHVFNQYEEDVLQRRAKGFRERFMPAGFEPIKRKKHGLEAESVLRRFQEMTAQEKFEFFRGLKPEEIASLPQSLQLQAQAIRVSAKDTVRISNQDRQAEQEKVYMRGYQEQSASGAYICPQGSAGRAPGGASGSKGPYSRGPGPSGGVGGARDNTSGGGPNNSGGRRYSQDHQQSGPRGGAYGNSGGGRKGGKNNWRDNPDNPNNISM